MGITKDYLDYLNREVGISPAGSQEELDCARTIADVFSSHGLEPQIQEFSAPSFGGVIHGALMVLVLVGIVLSGLSGALKVVGILLAVAGMVLLVMARAGRDVLGKLGPSAHSQNVVALHKAEGDDAAHNRPFVIMAHYDSPRIDPLARREAFAAKKYLATGFPYLVGAVAVCLLIQILVFLPEGARRTFWVIGIVASLPLAVWGVSLIASRFSPYTSGAVDNKSSVAAMLGVLERVCPTGEARRAAEQTPAEQAPAEGEADVAPEGQETRTAPALEMRREVEKVVGVRHGKRVLTELGILPASCEITYIEPEVRMVPVADATVDLHAAEPSKTRSLAASPEAYPPPHSGVDGSDGAPAADTTARPAPAVSNADATAALPADVDRAATEPDGRVSSGPVAPAPRPAVQEPTGADAPGEDATEDADSTHPLARRAERRVDTERVKAPATDPSATMQVSADFSQLENGQDETEGPLVETDHGGLGVMAEEDAETASSAPRAARPRPAAPADPEWGKSSYTPSRRRDTSGVARRAALFDLPDPLTDAEDGLAPSAAPARSSEAIPAPVSVVSASPAAPRSAQAPVQDEIKVLGVSSETVTSREAGSTRRGVGKLFGRRRRQEETSMTEWLGVEEGYDAKESGEDIGSWANFDADERPRGRSHWKGGAALSLRLRQLKESAEKAAEGAVAGVKGATSRLGHPSVASDDAQMDGSPEGTPAPPEAVERAQAQEEPRAIDAPNESAASSEETSSFPNVPADGVPGLVEAGAGTIAPLADRVPTDEDMRDAVLAMGDDDLRAHDIWFVATGASAYGHAGAKDFLNAHRKELRGSFVVNIDCVGAGALTVLTHEGFGTPRRADRRLGALLAAVADDLHVELGKLSRPWADTEATPLMRRSLRAVTIMGLGANELPACSGTADDVNENVDVRNVADVSALVAEAIRRS